MIIAVSLLCTLVNIPSLILRLIPFREKVSKEKFLSLLLCYGIGLVLNFILCLWFARTSALTVSIYKHDLLIFCTIMGCVNILLIPGYFREHLFTFGITALIVWLILAFSAYITSVIGYATITIGLILENCIGLFIYTLLYPWLKKLMYNTVSPFLNINGKNYWNTIWFIPIAMFLSGIFSHRMDEYTDTPLQLISRVMIGAATLLLCRSIAKDYRTFQEKEQMNEQLALQKKYYDALTATVGNEQAVRNTLKHRLTTIQNFLKNENIDGLRKYCDDLETSLTDIKEIPYTGNVAADGLLYHYASIAEKEKIKFTVCCKLNDLSVSDADLCCLLGNALDNALTACQDYAGEKYISLASEREQNMLLLTIDNSFDGVLLVEDGKILSRKQELADKNTLFEKQKVEPPLSLKQESKEGSGIHCMEQICAKYDGACRFHAEGEEFEASFMLSC